MNEAQKPDFRHEHQRNWITLLQKLFPDGIPEQTFWKGQNEIVQVLQTIVGTCRKSHYLYTPEQGSVELWQVTPSPLSQGIELSYSDTAVVYPVELLFYGFSEKPLWSYFRLITTATEPIGVLPKEVLNATVPSFSEFAYRTPVMHYSASEGEGGPTKEVRGSKELIKNYYKGGDFVLFSSISPFGKLWDRDGSLHQRLGDKGFRAYIEEQVNGQMAVAD